MKILKLKEQDIDNLLAIERACFAAPWTREMFAEEINSPFFNCLGVVVKERLAAFICFWQIADEYHIGNFAVLPEFRRQGIAKELLSFVVDMAKADGIKGLTLEVRKSNDAAISLYSAKGFKTEGIRPHYYENGEDALIMWLRL